MVLRVGVAARAVQAATGIQISRASARRLSNSRVNVEAVKEGASKAEGGKAPVSGEAVAGGGSTVLTPTGPPIPAGYQDAQSVVLFKPGEGFLDAGQRVTTFYQESTGIEAGLIEMAKWRFRMGTLNNSMFVPPQNAMALVPKMPALHPNSPFYQAPFLSREAFLTDFLEHSGRLPNAAEYPVAYERFCAAVVKGLKTHHAGGEGANITAVLQPLSTVPEPVLIRQLAIPEFEVMLNVVRSAAKNKGKAIPNLKKWKESGDYKSSVELVKEIVTGKFPGMPPRKVNPNYVMIGKDGKVKYAADVEADLRKAGGLVSQGKIFSMKEGSEGAKETFLHSVRKAFNSTAQGGGGKPSTTTTTPLTASKRVGGVGRRSNVVSGGGATGAPAKWDSSQTPQAAVTPPASFGAVKPPKSSAATTTTTTSAASSGSGGSSDKRVDGVSEKILADAKAAIKKKRMKEAAVAEDAADAAKEKELQDTLKKVSEPLRPIYEEVLRSMNVGGRRAAAKASKGTTEKAAGSSGHSSGHSSSSKGGETHKEMPGSDGNNSTSGSLMSVGLTALILYFQAKMSPDGREGTTREPPSTPGRTHSPPQQQQHEETMDSDFQKEGSYNQDFEMEEEVYPRVGEMNQVEQDNAGFRKGTPPVRGRRPRDITLAEFFTDLIPNRDVQLMLVSPDHKHVYVWAGDYRTLKKSQGEVLATRDPHKHHLAQGSATAGYADQQFALQGMEEEDVPSATRFPTRDTHQGYAPTAMTGYTHKFTIHSPKVLEFKLLQFCQQYGLDPVLEYPSLGYITPPTESSGYNVIMALATLAPAALMLVMFTSFKGSMPSMGGMMDGMTKNLAKVVKDSPTRFKDVAGLGEAKVEVQEIVSFLKDPSKYQALGARAPKGALLAGPPGTGKTLLARATAGESGVPFLETTGTDFIEMIGGVGGARVRDLFKQAREMAPCVVFIDEIDSIGGKRGNSMGNQERENTLNEILVQMDGFESTDGVVVLAATNRHDQLDAALMRPGRFDRLVSVDLPDIEGRVDILKVHLQKVQLEGEIPKVAEMLAEMTPGMSGADLANIVNEGALVAARGDTITKVTMAHFRAAIDRIIAGLELSKNIVSPKERKAVAYHEAGHAMVGWFLENTDPLVKITIVPRGKALGFAQYLPSENKLMTTEHLNDMICMALGGRAAELLCFGQLSSGAQDDLRRVTNIAYSQATTYGMMGDKLGLLTYPREDSQGGRKRNFSEETAMMIDDAVRNHVGDLAKKTSDLLTEKKELLGLVAEELLKKETLTRADFEKIVGPRPFPDPERPTLRGGKIVHSSGSRVADGFTADVEPVVAETPPKK